MLTIELMQDFSEVVHYEEAGIPLYIRTGELSIYPDMSAPCHWHDDIEWIYMIKGNMSYYINGKRILLKEKDSLMVNARQMHYGYAYKKQNCFFLCILFHPSLFGNNPLLLQKYVVPVLENSNLEYLHVSSGEALGQEVGGYLEQIGQLKEKGEKAYEMQVLAVMFQIWSRLLQEEKLLPGGREKKTGDTSDLEIQKDMVSFIYLHYAETISLKDIAAAGNISRSKCCLIFKHYLQQSPVDFLNTFRLKTSCNLLRSTKKSITEIAGTCGFNSLSYFSKQFLQSFGCTPREYRKASQKLS